MQETAEAPDVFGWALATGDFNGDGFADLAVGAPGETIGAASRAGIVHILYGSANGLAAQGNQVFHQDRPGVQETAEGGDTFGWALATGDFNGDGFADLAIGAPGEAFGAAGGVGGCAYPVWLSQRVNDARQSDIPSEPPRGAGNGRVP